MNKTNGEYIRIKVNIKQNTHILQDEDNSYIWDNVKMDPVKTEVNTEKSKKWRKNLRLGRIMGSYNTYIRLSKLFPSHNKKNVKISTCKHRKMS